MLVLLGIEWEASNGWSFWNQTTRAEGMDFDTFDWSCLQSLARVTFTFSPKLKCFLRLLFQIFFINSSITYLNFPIIKFSFIFNLVLKAQIEISDITSIMDECRWSIDYWTEQLDVILKVNILKILDQEWIPSHLLIKSPTWIIIVRLLILKWKSSGG